MIDLLSAQKDLFVAIMEGKLKIFIYCTILRYYLYRGKEHIKYRECSPGAIL